MGFFDFLKKKEKPAPPESSILLAMPMFRGDSRFLAEALAQHLESFWGLTLTKTESGQDTAVFDLEGESVAIAYVPAPVPAGDLEPTAAYAYNWPQALEDLKAHGGHALLTILSSKGTVVDRFRLLTKVLHSVLATSDAVGVYQGSQSLLIPREQYLESSKDLLRGATPVDLWVYIGLRRTEGGNSAYTYGLKLFGKQEMEVVDSAMSLEELYNFLLNIAAYVLGSNVTLRSGETLGYTADQKIRIAALPGQFVEGEALRLNL